MYIRRRLVQKGFLIIGTLVSPVSTAIGGGPYAELPSLHKGFLAVAKVWVQS